MLVESQCYGQAFDSINRRAMLIALKKFKIPQQLIRLVEVTLKDSRAKVLIAGRTSRNFDITCEVRQGDSLSAVLFNLALHEAMKELNLRGTIIYKTKQACAYADDITLVARNVDSLKEMFNFLERKKQNCGIRINEQKTKYMKMSTEEIGWTPNVTFGQYNFETVRHFNYLGDLLNCKNTMTEEINKWIMAGNSDYYANMKLFRSTLLSRHTKLKLYKTLIRPVVTYGAEEWTMTLADENSLRIFERKVLRKIYGPLKENHRWRIRINKEIQEIIDDEDIVRFVKSRRLEWLGHVEGMDENRMPKKILHGRMEGKRKRGRPRKRWLQDLQEDLRVMHVGRWGEKVQNREEWGRIVKEAKAHPGL
jgi:hypothetical protein